MLGVNLETQFVEHVLDPVARFVADLKIAAPVFVCQVLCLIFFNLSALVDVTLRATQHQHKLRGRISFQVLEPVVAAAEGLLTREVEAEDGCLDISVVHSGDLSESLLPGCIPDRQPDLLALLHLSKSMLLGVLGVQAQRLRLVVVGKCGLLLVLIE